MEFAEIQMVLASSHEYVMLLNAVLCCYVLVRDGKGLWNFYRLRSNRRDWVMVVAAVWLPGYYALEAVATVQMCGETYMTGCKYTVHHVLTVSLFGLMFGNDLLTGPSYMVQVTHGFMNFAYYYDSFLTYLLCKWYILTTVFCALHLTYHFLSPSTSSPLRLTLFLALIHLTALGVNNLYTDELVEICELEGSSSFDKSTKIWGAHIVFMALFTACVRKYTKPVPALPLYTDPDKYF